MHTEAILDYWHKLHTQQSDWAFRAYSRLIETLSADVQEKLRLNDQTAEPYIVIFGKTQVGKTTLLLDLMGIAPAQMAAVSQVLRGGREAGKSATATAMEYCRSENEFWGLSRQSKTELFQSDDDIKCELGKMREEMEHGHLVLDSPCVVHIPKQFFAEASSTAPNVRILDLPGDNPANQEEQKHVNRMAKTYLPFADLILLVGRGDDLGFLQPGVITLPGIEDWQAMPHRFRIVTTYSYLAQSVRDFLRAGQNVNASQLRQRLIQEIELFSKLSDAAKDEHRYFPLEFGTTWMDLEQKEPGLYKKVEPRITEFRTELLEQIANVTTPMGRLRSTLNTHLSVKYIQEKKEKDVNKAISNLKKEKDSISSEVSVWIKYIDKAQQKLDKTSDVLKNNSLKNGIKEIQKAAFKLPSTYPPKEGDKNSCDTLITMVRNYYSSLKDIRLDVANTDVYWKKVRGRAAKLEPEPNIIQGILDDEFSSIRHRLDNYSVDFYFWSSNYKDDRDRVHDAGNKSKTRLVNLWKDVWLKALKDIDKELHSEIFTAQSNFDIGTEEKEKLLKRKDDIQLNKNSNLEKLKEIERTGQEDLDRCEKFVHLLDEEYLAELTNRMDIALHENDNCHALLHLLSCVELSNQHEELMSLHENKME